MFSASLLCEIFFFSLKFFLNLLVQVQSLPDLLKVAKFDYLLETLRRKSDTRKLHGSDHAFIFYIFTSKVAVNSIINRPNPRTEPSHECASVQTIFSQGSLPIILFHPRRSLGSQGEILR